MRRNISLLLIIIIIITLAAFSVPANAAESFPDVPSTHWGYTYVTALADKGLIAGYPDGSFGPGRDITRAELVTIVIKSTFGSLTNGGSHWADNYMQKAIDSGLLLQDEFTRDTWNTPILRKDIALVAARAMEALMNEPPATDTDTLTAKITDWNTICNACKPYIAQVYAKGIAGGYPDGSFGDTKTATRAEAATMLTRLIDKSYRSVSIGGVGFTKKTDILPDGRMSIAKSLDYMNIILDNLCFYKENGKFYVKCNFPELPEEFENFLSVGWYLPDTSNLYTTHYIFRPETSIPATGEFIREIPGMTNTSTINDIVIHISIFSTKIKGIGKESVNYTIGYDRQNKISVNERLKNGKAYAIDYDFSKLFTW